MGGQSLHLGGQGVDMQLKPYWPKGKRHNRSIDVSELKPISLFMIVGKE